MLKTNSRFYIGLIVTELLSLLSLLSHNWIIIALVFLGLNALYLNMFFFTLSSLNKAKEAYDTKIANNPNAFHITPEEAYRMQKEGAIEKDGKMYVNKEFSEWKKAQRQQQ